MGPVGVGGRGSDPKSRIAVTSFLSRASGLGLRDRVSSSNIRREHGVEPLLLSVES